jgi:hypothetical protein
MKNTEKLISPLIQSMFPSFYKEEGQQFISFVKAYYEWLEEQNNVLYHTRRLTDYRDIDTTIDDFILHFKEKYLKNIQFDTATNKKLLIKNSLDLYRSKGTERSVDLFFKLVYGTNAEVRYPGEDVFKASDGVWERPTYLEVSGTTRNIDYVGKQVQGTLSNATAFVEKFIKRRIKGGYVSILYISNIQGNFRKGEVLGVNISGVNTTYNDSPKLIGSLNDVIIQDGGRDFKVGDIVKFVDSIKGNGGLARVDQVTDTSGVVDFIFIDGGWGYTLTANSIVSEKVVTTANVIANSTSKEYFGLFEPVVQPIVTINFGSATTAFSPGTSIFRYSSGNIVGSGVIIDLVQDQTLFSNGELTVSVTNGSFTNGVTYYTAGNTQSFFANTIEDESITGVYMGRPKVYDVVVTGLSNNVTLGSTLYQSNSTLIYASGKVESISQSLSGEVLSLANVSGAFKTTSIVGDRIKLSSDNSNVGNVTSVSFNMGVYEIKKDIHVIEFDNANNSSIQNTPNIYQYDLYGNVISKGVVLTVSPVVSNSGTLTIVPTKGFFTEASRFYTEGNTATATISVFSLNRDGGDYKPSPYSTAFGTVNNTRLQLTGTSFGSGANFEIGSIGDTEVIYINTDLIGANNENTLNYSKKIISVTNSTGFSVGDYVYQSNATANAFGTIYEIDSNNIKVKDVFNAFSNTAGDYGNLVFSVNTSVNTDILNVQSAAATATANQPFYSLPIRSDAYGFPKNPQGDIKDTIFSCLTFNRFEIGTIGSLTGVDPGSQYTADPFVLAYQRYIAGFDRKDYIITVTSPTGSFLTGEKINQTPSSLVLNNIQVDGQVVDDVYNEIVRTINANLSIDDTTNNNLILVPSTSVTIPSKTSVLSAEDTIVVPANSATFNANTNVNSIDDFITINPNPFSNGDLLLYTVSDGNTAVSGLTNATFYYAISSNSVGLRLSTQAGNSAAVVGVNATSVSETGHILNKFNNPYSNGDLVQYTVSAGNTAIGNLTNGNTYYVINTSSVGFKLTTDSGNVASIVNVTSTATQELGHFFVNFRNPFSNNTIVKYQVLPGNTAISGLANNTNYRVVETTDYGFKLANTTSLSVIDISKGSTEDGHYFSTLPGYLPGDRVYQTITKTFNGNTDVSSDFITISSNPFANGDLVTYANSAGNTAIITAGDYYAVYSNTTGLALSSSIGGANLTLTASPVSETGHSLTSTPTAAIKEVFTEGANSFVQVNNIENSFYPGTPLFSNTYNHLNSNVVSVNLFSISSTAKGVIKSGSTPNTLFVKRINFENTFNVGEEITGDSSGTKATIVDIIEDENTYPIGVNAIIEANVVTAIGEITSLQITDSGVGYPNGEIIQFSSMDGTREGTVKAIVGGNGKGAGYYRSSKGFLSSDKYIHDGDYYQEYSYEVLSKMSFDRYSDMFKKVMHVAGTKVFGSSLIVEEDSANVSLSLISTENEVNFNAQSDVSSIDDTIELDIEVTKNLRSINAQESVDNINEFITITTNVTDNPNPFVDGDIVKYYVAAGNTANIGLTDQNVYKVVEANNSGFKLTSTAGGSVINLSKGGNENGHYFINYRQPFSDEDEVLYYVDYKEINSYDGIDSANDFIYVANNDLSNGTLVTYITFDNVTPISGLTSNTDYYTINTNSNGFKLATQQGNVSSIVNVASVSGITNAIQILNGGRGYDSTVNNQLIFNGGNSFNIGSGSVKPVATFANNANGTIVSVTVSNVGIGYSTSPTISINTTSMNVTSQATLIAKIDFGYGHMLTTNKVISGLEQFGKYYVVNSTPHTVKLSLTPNGSPINITQGSDQVKHYLKKIVEEI